VRSSNGFIELGVLAGPTLQKADNGVFWLASDKTVRRLEGVTPVRVSTYAIEQILEDAQDVSDAFAFTYTHQGHVFYALTLPSAARTLVYDIGTNEWHERESYGVSRWAANAACECYGRVFVGHYADGRVGELNALTYAEWDDVQRMSWIYGSAFDDGARLFHSELEIDVETGVGLSQGQGSDPRATLYYANDGGQVFSAMPTRSLGAQGARRQRVRWNRLGMARDRVYRVDISDPVRVTVHGTRLEVERGRA
jgi:hypothetical protein